MINRYIEYTEKLIVETNKLIEISERFKRSEFGALKPDYENINKQKQKIQDIEKILSELKEDIQYDTISRNSNY